jgi:hypothetical protein
MATLTGSSCDVFTLAFHGHKKPPEGGGLLLRLLSWWAISLQRARRHPLRRVVRIAMDDPCEFLGHCGVTTEHLGNR